MIDMEYFLISLAVICIGSTFVFDKLYQKNVVTDCRQLFVYPLLKSLIAIPLFIGLNNFSLDIQAYGVLMAGAYALLVATYTILGMIAVKYGKLSIYTMFLMIGGMILPYLYGVIYLREELNLARIIGICLLFIALVLNAVGTQDDRKIKTSWKFWVLCAIVFVLNGSVSIVSKAHQINSQAIGTFSFIAWSNIFQCVFALIGLFVSFLIVKDNKEKIPIVQKEKLKWLIGIVFCVVVLTGVNTVSSLTAAKTLPAVVQYPFITGGVTIVTTLAARFLFKEKISCLTTCSLIILLCGTLLFLF